MINLGQGHLQTCQPPENSKREIARNSDFLNTISMQLNARALGPVKFQGGRFFLQEGDFLQLFKKTILVIGKGNIPLVFIDTKPFKQGIIETVSYLGY